MSRNKGGLIRFSLNRVDQLPAEKNIVFTVHNHHHAITMLRSYRSNIIYLYLIKLSKWLLLIMPIIALYYKSNGLDQADLLKLQAIYSLSVAIMEIPSGYLADIVGRRTTLLLGAVLGTLGYLLYASTSGFSGFLMAEIVLGIGGSFISGADSAMLFDSLAAMDDRHRYLQFEGRITSIGNFAETVAAICGGLIAAWCTYRSVYIAQTIVAAMAIPAAWLLIEPPKAILTGTAGATGTTGVAKTVHVRPGLGHILSVCRHAIFEDKSLSSAIIFSSVTGITTLSFAWSCQLYFVQHGFTETIITPLWVALNLTVAVSAAFAARLIAALGNRRALLFILLLFPLSYVAMAIFPIGFAMGMLFIFYAIRGYATPLLKDMINQLCGSETRATILSIRSLIIRCGFALLGPAMALVSRRYNLNTAFLWTGIVLFFLFLLSTLFLRWTLPDFFTGHNQATPKAPHPIAANLKKMTPQNNTSAESSENT